MSWKTKKQVTVSSSSVETEYRALAVTAWELQWITYVLGDLQVHFSLPINFWCDNRAAIHISANHVFHERTKHIDIDCHVVRNLYKAGFISLNHISTKQQVADVFTKSLSSPIFHVLLDKMGFAPVHLEEGVLRSKERRSKLLQQANRSWIE